MASFICTCWSFLSEIFWFSVFSTKKKNEIVPLDLSHRQCAIKSNVSKKVGAKYVGCVDKKLIDRALWYCQTFRQASRLRRVVCFAAKCASVSKMQPRIDFLSSKAGILLAHLTSPFCWLSPWHNHSVNRTEVRSPARHVVLQAWLHLLTWGDKGSCDTGNQCSIGVRLQITMQTPCSSTVAFTWLTKSGQYHLFPQICALCAAWSLLNRSTPAICLSACIEPAAGEEKVAWLPCSFGLWVCTSLYWRVYMCLAKFLPTLTT